MKAIWNFISTFFILALTFWFVRWYIKGHFGKYAVLFWLNTIFAIIMQISAVANKPEEDNTPGYVYWERNVKSH